jgi:hypothetical protein
MRPMSYCNEHSSVQTDRLVLASKDTIVDHQVVRVDDTDVRWDLLVLVQLYYIALRQVLRLDEFLLAISYDLNITR